MAVKSRVLQALTDVKKEFHVSKGEEILVDTVTVRKGLQVASDLCRLGLSTQYCLLYSEVFDGISQAINTLTEEVGQESKLEVISLCCELLDDVSENLAREIHFKKEIVFLPYQSAMWDSMESVWQAAVADSEHAIPYVMPIPYCDLTPEGGVREWHYEGGKFPEYVRITDFQQTDLEAMHPDVIVIHNPYDNYNLVTSVDASYYSSQLKKWTDKLVYIPYYVLDEVDSDNDEILDNLAHFIFSGLGVINANLTIVQSENMREAYIRLLVRNTDKDRKYWEKRILGLGSPKFDKLLSTKREDIELPESWRQVIDKPDGTRKKVILYNVHLNNLLKNKEKTIEKMEWVLQTFRERQYEVALLWRPHPLFESTIQSRVPEVWERYQRMVQRYRSEGWGIFDDSADLDRAIVISDGYYGDMSSLICLCHARQMPIMLQTSTITADSAEWPLLTPMSATFVREEYAVYMWLYSLEALVKVDLATGVMSLVQHVPCLVSDNGKGNINSFREFMPFYYALNTPHWFMVSVNHIVFLLPWIGANISVYDTTTGALVQVNVTQFQKSSVVKLPKNLEIVSASEYQGFLYMFSSYGLVIAYDMKSEKCYFYSELYEQSLLDNKKIFFFGNGNCVPIVNGKAWMVFGGTQVVSFDLGSKTWRIHPLTVQSPEQFIGLLPYNDIFILLTDRDKYAKWCPERGFIYRSPSLMGNFDNLVSSYPYFYGSSYIVRDKLVLIPIPEDAKREIIVIDLTTDKIDRSVSFMENSLGEFNLIRVDDDNYIQYSMIKDSWYNFDERLHGELLCHNIYDSSLLSLINARRYPFTDYRIVVETNSFTLKQLMNYTVKISGVPICHTADEGCGKKIKDALLL